MLTQTRLLRQFFRLDFIFKGLFLLTLSLLLTACGGGGGGGAVGGGGGGGPVAGGGIGGTGSVAAIASVTVNGVKFSCVGAIVSDDDGTIAQGAGDACVDAQAAGRLSVGSVVTVTGTGSKDASGNPIAATVNVSRSVFGPAANVSIAGQSFTVLNQTVQVDQNTSFKGLTNFSALTNGTTVEVSGFRTPATTAFPNGTILATLVEKKTVASGQSELKGLVVGTGSISINGVNIALTLNETAPPAGTCVEAKGSFNAGTLTLTQALKRDDDCTGGSALSGSLNQAQVEGVISNFVSLTNFNVGSQAVIASAATIFGGTALDLLDGVKVEAEGSLTNGVLVATKIQIKSNGVRIKATADGAYNSSTGIVSVLGIDVKVVTATELDGNPLTIVTGTRVEIEGSKSGAKSINATKLKVISGGGGGNTPELRGPLDAKPITGSFSILRVRINTSGATFRSASGVVINETTFIANTNADNIVKAKGAVNPNNQITATEVENED